MSFLHPLLPTPLDRQVAIDVTIERAHSYELMQYKYDGIWGCLYKDIETRFPCIRSRNGLIKDNINCDIPLNTIIVGEYMYGSQWSQAPDRKDKFYVYDCVCFGGQDFRTQTYQHRYSYAKEVVEMCNSPRVQFAQSFTSSNVTEAIRRMESARNYEGIIVRNWNEPYSAEIGRYKLDIDDDFVITNINEGEGRNAGRLGSITVGQFVGNTLADIMDVGGGFSDTLREEIYTHPFAYIGKVVKIGGKLRFSSGAFRHPNFIQFRHDKSPRECIFIKQSLANTTE